MIFTLIFRSTSNAPAAIFGAGDQRRSAEALATDASLDPKQSTKLCLQAFVAGFQKQGVTVVGDGQLAVSVKGKPLRILSPLGRTTEVDPSGNCRAVPSPSGESYSSVMEIAYAHLMQAARSAGKCRVGSAGVTDCDTTPGASGSVQNASHGSEPASIAACKNSDIELLQGYPRKGFPTNAADAGRAGGAAK